MCMMCRAVLLVAVEINSDKDKSRERGEDWKGTEDVVIISVNTFLVIGFKLFIECHLCPLVTMEKRVTISAGNVKRSIKYHVSKNRLVLDEAFSRYMRDWT